MSSPRRLSVPLPYEPFAIPAFEMAAATTSRTATDGELDTSPNHMRHVAVMPGAMPVMEEGVDKPASYCVYGG